MGDKFGGLKNGRSEGVYIVGISVMQTWEQEGEI